MLQNRKIFFVSKKIASLGEQPQPNIFLSDDEDSTDGNENLNASGVLVDEKTQNFDAKV